MDEYRIKITIRNNLLLSAIEAAGYTEFGGLNVKADRWMSRSAHQRALI